MGLAAESITIPETDAVITAENVTDPDIIREIVKIGPFKDRQRVHMEALNLAGSIRKKGEFQRIYKQQWALALQNNLGTYSNIYSGQRPEDEWAIPYDYTMDMDGISVPKETQNGIMIKKIAPAPIYIECVVTDRSNPACPQKSVELHYFDLTCGRWEQAVVPEGVIMDTTKCKQLADLGVLFDPSEVNELVQFFYKLRTMNRVGSNHPIREYNAVTKLGWKYIDDQWIFLPYDTAENCRFSGGKENRRLYDALKQKPKGNFDTWLSVAKPAILRDINLRIFIDASVASVLVVPTQSIPFVVHLYGGSGVGKTVAMSLAASIWGPSHPQTGGYIGSWSTTRVGAEMRCDLLGDIPMLMDDTAQAERNIRDFSAFIYELAAGRGKMRATKRLERQRDFSWQCLTLSTGEHPIVDDDTQGGAINRVISLHAEKSAFDDFAAATSVIYDNYGFAGREIINFIKEMGFNFFKARKSDYAQKLNRLFGKNGNDTTKQSESLALLLAADEILATQVLEIPPLTADDMAPFYTSLDAIDENLQAYDVLKTAVLSQKRQHFFEDRTTVEGDKEFHNPTFPTFDLWGRFIDEHYDNDTVTIDIIPRIFKKIVKDAKYDPTIFLNWLDHQGLLTHERGRLTCRRSLQPGDKKIRVYEIDLKLDDFAPSSSDDDKIPDDLPY
jgi:putative DNA primase/helicase